MTIKLFLDTNIFLDLFDDKRPKHLESVKLFRKIENDEVLAYTSESVMTTMDYILRKLLNANTVKEIITEILKNVTILSCNNLIITRALHSELNDLEDAILYEIAIENRLSYFITHDAELLKKTFTRQIPALSVQAFLDNVD